MRKLATIRTSSIGVAGHRPYVPQIASKCNAQARGGLGEPYLHDVAKEKAQQKQVQPSLATPAASTRGRMPCIASARMPATRWVALPRACTVTVLQEPHKRTVTCPNWVRSR